jgi:broad specificity phosphatase PhoE
MLLVVRHADAGDKRGWKGPDLLRPLSAAGRRQADGLVVRLEDYPIERILCSPSLRCVQTVQPLAGDRFLEIEPLAAKGSTWLLQRHDRRQVLGRLLAPLELELAEP